MSAHLPPCAWLAAPQTRAVMAALGGGERPPMARFVGGCVRDTLLGRPVGDIDIAVRHTPQKVIELAVAAGLKSVPTGIDHGTVTVIAGSTPFEVTTLRIDAQTDGRRAVVVYTDDWAADAARRDFTMNALYADADGAVFDPVGGQPDLEAGRVRFIGAPAARIAEDHLRILRFFRFHAWFGAGAVDGEGLAACAAARETLRDLSAERVWKEMRRLLEAPDPCGAVAAMAATGILRIVLPEWTGATALDLLAGVIAAERACALEPLALRRFAALVPADPALISALAGRLRLSGAERDALAAFMARTELPLADWSDRRLTHHLYARGESAGREDAVYAAARSGDPQAFAPLVARMRALRAPVFPVKGQDLIALGAAPGPGLGQALKDLEAWWAARDFVPDRAALIAEAKRRI